MPTKLPKLRADGFDKEVFHAGMCHMAYSYNTPYRI